MAGAQSSALNVGSGPQNCRLQLERQECAGDLPISDRPPTNAVDPLRSGVSFPPTDRFTLIPAVRWCVVAIRKLGDRSFAVFQVQLVHDRDRLEEGGQFPS